jgi:hypothetical protein
MNFGYGIRFCTLYSYPPKSLKAKHSKSLKRTYIFLALWAILAELVAGFPALGNLSESLYLPR